MWSVCSRHGLASIEVTIFLRWLPALLQRVLLGSVADNLIQHLDCPIILIPSHGVTATERPIADRVTAGVVSA
jgi:hypothetical protein